MTKLRILRLLAALAVLALVATACGGSSEEAAGTGDGAAAAEGVCASVDANAGDLLAKICSEGVITAATDPAYPPQSSLDEATGEFVGFDIDVTTEIARRLGVEVAWETPAWDVLTAGNWNGRWDMTVGSMTPTNDRQEVIWFTQPYYYGLAVAVVPADSTVTDVAADLDGKKIGVCSGCTYDAFLNRTLSITGFDFDFVVDSPEIVGYDTDTTALADLAVGRLDAVLTSATTAQGWIDEGNAGKIVGGPLFGEPMSVGFDKSSELDPSSLLAAVDAIVAEMRADGTLSQFSIQWFGIDLSTV